jgi:hypothetical protein
LLLRRLPSRSPEPLADRGTLAGLQAAEDRADRGELAWLRAAEELAGLGAPGARDQIDAAAGFGVWRRFQASEEAADGAPAAENFAGGRLMETT